MIVGYPSETEEEFSTTVENLKKIKFYKMHIFKYSPRRGTVAEKMENQISGDIKDKRSRILLDLSDEFEREYMLSYIGKTYSVLFEEQDGEFYKGHTANYILVKVKTEEDISNKILDVCFEEVDKDSIIGKLVWNITKN